MAKKYDAGVKEYRETYWMPDYTPKDTDLLACFKITPSRVCRVKKLLLRLLPNLQPVPGPRCGPTC